MHTRYFHLNYFQYLGVKEIFVEVNRRKLKAFREDLRLFGKSVRKNPLSKKITIHILHYFFKATTIQR